MRNVQSMSGPRAIEPGDSVRANPEQPTMPDLRLPAVVLVVAAIGFLGFVTWTPEGLPERLATHFDAQGQADGWMSRRGHQTGLLLLGLGLASLLAGVFWMVRFFPDRAINLPRREVWLSARHRPATMAWLQRQGLWLAAMTLVLLGGVHAQVMAANLEAARTGLPPRLVASTWLLVVGFFVALGVWSVRLVLRFARPPRDRAEAEGS